MATIKCPYCDTEVDESVVKCPTCGAILKTLPDVVLEQNDAQSDSNTNAVTPEKKKHISRRKIIIYSAAAAVVAACIIAFFATGNLRKYLFAQNDLKNGAYEKAETAFKDLGDYRDSQDMYKECFYQDGISKLNNKNYNDAITSFKNVKDYNDAKSKIEQCYYLLAIDSLNNKKYSDALDAFKNDNNYQDTQDKIKECYYYLGLAELDKSNFENALGFFNDSKGFKDVTNEIAQCNYGLAEKQFNEKNYVKAGTYYAAAGDYKDADDKRKECIYQEGMQYFQDGKYQSASQCFKNINGYNDADAQYVVCQYDYAKQLVKQYDREKAAKIFASINYQDSTELASIYSKLGDTRAYKGYFYWFSDEFGKVLQSNLAKLKGNYTASIRDVSDGNVYFDLYSGSKVSSVHIVLMGMDDELGRFSSYVVYNSNAGNDGEVEAVAIVVLTVMSNPDLALNDAVHLSSRVLDEKIIQREGITYIFGQQDGVSMYQVSVDS